MRLEAVHGKLAPDVHHLGSFGDDVFPEGAVAVRLFGSPHQGLTKIAWQYVKQILFHLLLGGKSAAGFMQLLDGTVKLDDSSVDAFKFADGLGLPNGSSEPGQP